MTFLDSLLYFLRRLSTKHGERPMTIVAEPSWDRVMEEVLGLRGAIFLLGTTDSGKSTLARHLLRELTGRRLKVALVDADIGQSALGLPGTVSMKIFRTPVYLGPYMYERICFIGSASPVHAMPMLIEETGKMADAAREAAEIIIIDTTGLVAGTLGEALKLGKIRRVRPSLIIAIEHHDELKHIISSIEDIPVRVLKPSPLVTNRNQETRTIYRQRRLADYFATAAEEEFLLTHHDADFIYRNRTVNLRDMRVASGTVIGLNHGQVTLALGIVDESDNASITFRSPLAGLKGINRVVLGDIVLENRQAPSGDGSFTQ
jgi:polynucleotide 5'-hydroxyl-kinase GRC3/NOL9